MPAADESSWRASSAGEFYDSGEKAVVYFHQASGNTHLLTPVACAILKALEQGSCSVSQLASALSPQIADIELSDLEASLPDLLEELRELEIIEKG